MKLLKVGAVMGGLAIAAIGVAVVTNPTQETYEAFATQQLIQYLSENMCIKVPEGFGLKQECRTLLNSNQNEIQTFIAKGTQRQNYLFFSIYTTDLSLTSFLPSYHFETVGIFHQFYIYQTKEKPRG